MHGSLAALGAVLLAAALPAATGTAAAASLGACPFGTRVVDRLGDAGIIVSASHSLCIVRYPDGHVLGWMAPSLRRAVASPATASNPAGTEASTPRRLITPPSSAARPAGSSGVTVLRSQPSPSAVVLHADRGGHFWTMAQVDGTPVRFLVDTGANLLGLNLTAAEAIGFRPDDLVFDRTIETANGRTRGAVVRLDRITLNGITVRGIAAAVVKNSNISVLGMNFLNRLRRFEINGNILTLER